MIIIIAGILISYLLGAMPAAYLLVKVVKGDDIRDFGSGNVGATNATRVIGKGFGFLVLLFDIGKGVIAVTFLSFLFHSRIDLAPEVIKSLFGMAVVCGHVFNVLLGFKGGKGVATSAGVLIGLNPWAFLVGVIIFTIVVFISKYVSLGSIVACTVIPFFMLLHRSHYSYVIVSALLCILIVAKHKSNIKRLLAGREKKVFEKK